MFASPPTPCSRTIRTRPSRNRTFLRVKREAIQTHKKSRNIHCNGFLHPKTFLNFRRWILNLPSQSTRAEAFLASLPKHSRRKSILIKLFEARGHLGLTRHEAAEEMELPVQSLCRPFCELRSAGVIVETSQRRVSRHGGDCTVLVLAQPGLGFGAERETSISINEALPNKPKTHPKNSSDECRRHLGEKRWALEYQRAFDELVRESRKAGTWAGTSDEQFEAAAKARVASKFLPARNRVTGG